MGVSDQLLLSDRDRRTGSMVHESHKMWGEPNIVWTVREMDVECEIFLSSADHIY